MIRIFKNILFSSIILIIFFLGAEIIARIGYSYVKHDIKYLYYGKTFFKLTGRRIINKINSSSAKVSNHVFSDSETRIWLFGGSTTACSYEEDEKSWPYKLAIYLKNSLNVSVTVVNFGKDGATCKEYVEQLVPILASSTLLSPDVVIVYMGINDSIKLSKYADALNRRPSIMQIINKDLMDISVAYMLLKMTYCKYVENGVDKAWTGYLSADEKELERHLSKFISLVGDMNPKIVIFFEVLKDSFLNLPPASYNLPGLADPFRRVRLTIEGVAKKHGIDFVDTKEEIRSICKDFDRYIPDGMHMVDEGNDLFARYIADYLIQKRFCKKQPSSGKKTSWQFINLRLVENPPRKIRIYKGE